MPAKSQGRDAESVGKQCFETKNRATTPRPLQIGRPQFFIAFLQRIYDRKTVFGGLSAQKIGEVFHIQISEFRESGRGCSGTYMPRGSKLVGFFLEDLVLASVRVPPHGLGVAEELGDLQRCLRKFLGDFQRAFGAPGGLYSSSRG